MKPSTADGYDPATTLQAKATCLYVATKLGDLMDDMVIIGGLVPSLLIAQSFRVNSPEAHVGTMDVDLALNVELLRSGLFTRPLLNASVAQASRSMPTSAAIPHGNGGGRIQPILVLALAEGS